MPHLSVAFPRSLKKPITALLFGRVTIFEAQKRADWEVGATLTPGKTSSVSSVPSM